MSCWHFRSELRDCPGLAAGLAAVVLLASLLPWFAGVPVPWAAALTALALATLPATLASVPGRVCPVKALSGGPEGLTLLPAGTPAAPLPATRVLPGLVLLHARTGSRRQVLWLPRSSMAPAEFRRLKAALLAARHGAAADA